MRTFVPLAAAVVAALASAADPAAVKLGGPRDVRGAVTSAADAHLVVVTFRPVKAFDAATNDEVNRDLGREFAVRVLARHLFGDRDAAFDVAREAVREAKADGERFRVTVAWPKAAVRAAGKAEPPAARRVPAAAFADAFFTARQDHLDTLAAVMSGTAAALRDARAKAAAAEPDDRRRVLARGVTRAEDRGTAALDALAAAVKADANLLDTTERPEVAVAIAAARKELAAALRAALDDPLKPAAPALKGVEIEKPFDGFLAAAPLLMDVGGAAVAEIGGETYLVGVAKTLLKDGSAEDILRAEKVTTLKARTAVIGERDGAKITYLKRVEDRVVVVDDGTGPKAATASERLKVTQESIAGTAKNLPVVGRWRSADGKLFYLAVGGKYSPGK